MVPNRQDSHNTSLGFSLISTFIDVGSGRVPAKVRAAQGVRLHLHLRPRTRVRRAPAALQGQGQGRRRGGEGGHDGAQVQLQSSLGLLAE